MNRKKAEQLLEKYRNNELSPKEIGDIETWYATYLKLQPGLSDEQVFHQRLAEMDAAFPFPKKARSFWPRYIAAASIILALAVGAYFILHRTVLKQQTAQLIKNDIGPGHQRATLTLSNGKKIVLNKGLSGNIAIQGNTAVNADHNRISYTADGLATEKLSYNTLTTARGEQSPYPLILADGTKVWLNAQSSITFPVAFNRAERRVKITGEAYFEVVHQVGHPFIVESNGQLTEDIGTSFNINSYADEPTKKTTLVEGEIKVNGKSLIPGQQSVLTNGKLQVTDANMQQVMAWKDGNFRFDGEKIDAIMRQLQRWYDIEVSYEGEIPKEVFYARVSQYKTIKQVLRDLAYTNAVQFKVEGRRVTVIR